MHPTATLHPRRIPTLLSGPQADAMEQALLAALPLGPQTPAGGVTLPESFKVGRACVCMCA